MSSTGTRSPAATNRAAAAVKSTDHVELAVRGAATTVRNINHDELAIRGAATTAKNINHVELAVQGAALDGQFDITIPGERLAANPQSSAPKNKARRKNQNSTTNHLQNRDRPLRAKESMADCRNNDKLKSNDHIRHNQGHVNAMNEEWQCM
jgi:hypothetical protein